MSRNIPVTLCLTAITFAALTSGATALAAERTRTAAEALRGNPNWAEAPSAPVLEANYPAQAINRRLSGAAVIGCVVQESGRLDECAVMVEKPRGTGFGEAALKVSRYYRLKPTTATGQKTAGKWVELPVRFNLQGEGGRPKLYPGESAMLVTPITGRPLSNRMVFPCPTSKVPDRRCKAHPFDWAQGLTYSPTMTVLRKSDQTAGVSLVECSAGPDGALHSCRVGGVATPASSAAILELTRQYRAPARALDRTAVAKGRIVVDVDWADVNPTPGAPAAN